MVGWVHPVPKTTKVAQPFERREVDLAMLKDAVVAMDDLLAIGPSEMEVGAFWYRNKALNDLVNRVFKERGIPRRHVD